MMIIIIIQGKCTI